jgi:molecular chaperone IbpA
MLNELPQSKLSALPRIDTTTLNRALVGFDNMFKYANQLSNSNYPPHNIIKTDDDNYVIELAVAGFKKSEITVEVDRESLIISGTKDKDPATAVEYLHRGLSSRDFTRQFTLAEHVVVKNATIQDGILSVYLERVVPEEKKRKLIAITEV